MNKGVFMKAQMALGFSVLSLLAGVALTASRASAQERTAPALGDNDDAAHSVPHMTQVAAEHYCRVRRSRLPTARELALVSVSHGACDILSPSEYASHQGTVRCPKSNYYHTRVGVSSQEPAGDDFYFSADGYRQPSGDEGNDFFCSSSVHPVVSSGAYGFLVVSGHDGGVYARDSYVVSAVRCVR